MSKHSIINEIAQYFNNHDQTQRIKKLMYYANSKEWINDSEKLEMLSSQNLVEQLRKSNSTIDELSYLMNRMVETLNRQDIYTNIANIIIQNFSKLYNDSEETTQIVFVDSKKSNDLGIDDYLIDRVVASLEENIDSARIKKLIFCSCKKRWENNPHILEQYSWYDLIYELRQQNSNIDKLKQSLVKVVKTLNRQAVYSNIAKIIVQFSEILYQESSIVNKVEKTKADINENQPSNSFGTAVIDNESIQALYEAEGILPNQNQDINEEQNSPVIKITTNIKSPELQKEYNIFEIKMSLMQYANPLRAKILLFSVLDHKFDNTWQDWSLLKTFELEELIKEIYNKTSTISDLKSDLNATAKFLDDKNEYIQASQAIVKALTPYYYK